MRTGLKERFHGERMRARCREVKRADDFRCTEGTEENCLRQTPCRA
jgi:hypothetical protein